MALKIYEEFGERLVFLSTRAATSAAAGIARRLPGSTFARVPSSDDACQVYAEEIELAGRQLLQEALESYDVAARVFMVRRSILKNLLRESLKSYVAAARKMAPIPAGNRTAAQHILALRFMNLADVLVDEAEQHSGRFTAKRESWFDRHPVATKAAGYFLTFAGGVAAALITKWLGRYLSIG